MTTPLLTLNATLEGRRLLTHPFYRRWEEGRLTRDDLTHYAEQYRHFEAYLPTFLSSLSERLDDGPARDAVRDNLRDETAAPSHLELFDRFAAAFAAGTVDASPAMASLLAAYDDALADDDAVALAGLLAYEAQGAEIAESKLAGLRDLYDAPLEALEFWTAHTSVEGEHARWTLDGLTSLAPFDDDVERGVALIADAWWRFLDEREALALA